MSFGRPPSINAGFKPGAPDRGSFPLDHFGECKRKMQLYMACLREHAGTSTPCRILVRDYLDCRMSKGLMEKDDWKNLGLANLDKNVVPATNADNATPRANSERPKDKKL